MTAGDGFDAGGESACWMHLVCPECGAVVSDDDGHDCVDTPESQPGASPSGGRRDREG